MWWRWKYIFEIKNLEILFSVVSRVSKFIFFQPSFITLHSYYEWNNNTFLPFNDNCISFEMRWIFFFSIQFNPVRSVILRNITFVFDEFWKRLSFFSYSFKRDVTWQTSFSSRLTTCFQPNTISNNDSIVNFLLSTTFHLPTIWIVKHFHLWSHHRHLKSRQMNRLFLSISSLQFISS